MPSRAPTIRERRLAGELRRLREGAGLTLPSAAEQLGWSKTKLSRIETVLRRVTTVEVQQLLDLYEITGPRREGLISFARTAKQRGWWDAYGDTLPTDYANYIALEAEAASLSCHSMGLVHGLLQTEDYARQVIRSMLMRFSPPAEVERRVDVRMTRQAVLTEREPVLRFWSIIDESTLRRTVGGKELMQAQYARLVELAEIPNVMLQVMPADAGAHPGTVGSFTILEFPDRFTPDIVYVESMTSALYIEDEGEVHTYSLAFEQMRATALSPDDTVALLKRLQSG